MTLSRRDFLFQSAVAAATAGVVSSAELPAAATGDVVQIPPQIPQPKVQQDDLRGMPPLFLGETWKQVVDVGDPEIGWRFTVWSRGTPYRWNSIISWPERDWTFRSTSPITKNWFRPWEGEVPCGLRYRIRGDSPLSPNWGWQKFSPAEAHHFLFVRDHNQEAMWVRCTFNGQVYFALRDSEVRNITTHQPVPDAVSCDAGEGWLVTAIREYRRRFVTGSDKFELPCQEESLLIRDLAGYMRTARYRHLWAREMSVDADAKLDPYYGTPETHPPVGATVLSQEQLVAFGLLWFVYIDHPEGEVENYLKNTEWLEANNTPWWNRRFLAQHLNQKCNERSKHI